MARALQCPKCGARNGSEVFAGRADFECPSCGQRLKVPEALRAAGAATAGGSGAGAGRTAATRTGVDSGDPTPQRPPSTGRRVAATAGAASSPGAASKPTDVPRARPRLIWRILAWAVAVFLGGFIVFAVGRAVGYLDGQRALDIVISTGISRYTVLLPLVPIWAVVTTVLVTIFIDGGQALARRRRARHVDRPGDDSSRSSVNGPRPAPVTPDAHGVSDDPAPVRRSGAARRAGGHPD